MPRPTLEVRNHSGFIQNLSQLQKQIQYLYNKTSENTSERQEGIRNETSIESGEQLSKLRIKTHKVQLPK